MRSAGTGVDPGFWSGRRVLVTGHTGFKGSWLSLWLETMGAELAGLSRDVPTSPSLYEMAHVGDGVRMFDADVRDLPAVERAIDAARRAEGVRVVVVVTSDKCYENREWVWGYREHEAMGGLDPYSNSKGCAELVASAYRRSFPSGPGIASARAGNVIGGGDWAEDRLIPDIMNAALEGRPVAIRNPDAVRPWQHVLNPLSGYLLLAQALWDSPEHADGWNFGPEDRDARPVRWIIDTLSDAWGEPIAWAHDGGENPHGPTTSRSTPPRPARGLRGSRVGTSRTRS